MEELFGTAGIRGPPDEVTPSLALGIGSVIGDMSSEVVVGRDGRHSGETLANALKSGVKSAGAHVVEIGVVPTHVLGWYTSRRNDEEEVMGVMLTASHNPPRDNGIKVFGSDGKEVSENVENEIEDAYDELVSGSGAEVFADWSDWRKSEARDVTDAYLEKAHDFVRSKMSEELDLRVAVDCGNGVGALTTPPLLRKLGCEVVGVNAQVDGSFPGRDPKPQPSTLGDFVEIMHDGNFDLGFAHDGDADRLVVVGPNGIVPEDAVVAVLAEEYVRESDMETPVVLTTPNASGKIDQRVENVGGRVERTALGYLPESVHEDVVFAAEPWKHIFPDFGGWIDGSLTAAEVARLASRGGGGGGGGGISELLGDLVDISVDKTSLDCPEDLKQGVMEAVSEELPREFDASVDTSYGVRLDFDGGRWILVRPSGTEPKIRVYVEGEDELMERTVGIVERLIESRRS